jgi:predicted ATPase/DNA-binding winged helix-turn-helix (wHTH) protein
MEPDARNPACVAFGRFVLLPHRRELLADDEPVRLGARAFDVLMALVEARGAAVGKDALAARVWPGQIVLDTALQSQISALRTALGADRDLIRTVSGRGYQFVGDIRSDPAAEPATHGAAATPPPEASMPPTNLPGQISELIGRDKELDDVEALVASHRLVTLTGAGGIGKTRLALAAARRLMAKFPDGVWVVELSPLSDAGLVPATIAMAVGMDPGIAARQHVVRALAARPLLLVLDTCEHVIGAVAAMAEELLRAGAAAHIIATSREPLRAEGEWIYPVPILAVPPEEAHADDLPRYGAVRLFVERARAAAPHFAPDARDMAAVAAICRRLDGIPLAIELAAAGTAMFGVKQLVAHLNDCFRLLTGGRRTALPRHQTLRATLDWSHALLAEPERAILRRLAIFNGEFSLEAAEAVAANSEIPPARVIQGLSDLVAKSLVATEMDRIARYRLLDTTQAYALEKLQESGEREALARTHAEYYRDLFEDAEAEWETIPTTEWMTQYDRKVGNLRAALTWAFSPEGDPAIGVRTTAAAGPLWLEMSLFSESHVWTGRALDALDETDRGTRREMVLQILFGYSRMLTFGTDEVARAALTRGRHIAEARNDAEFELRALLALINFSHRLEELAESLALARRAETIAKAIGDPMAASSISGMLSVSHCLLGNYKEALDCAERGNRLLRGAVVRSHLIHFATDQSVRARGITAIALWLTGLPDQSEQMARDLLDDVKDHPFLRSLTLTWVGCPIALRRGDRDVAAARIAELKRLAESQSSASYLGCALGYEGELLATAGELQVARGLLQAGLDQLRTARYEVLYTVFLSGLAEVMALSGLAQARVFAREAATRAERSRAFWWLPEALRIEGEVLLRLEGPACAQVEASFRRSLELAHQHGALSWELRAATSLARTLHDRGRSAEAMEILRPVHGRFTEGFDTADLESARALLDVLPVSLNDNEGKRLFS